MGSVSVRSIAMAAEAEKAAKSELTESELPGEHCGGATTSPGT